MFFTRKHLCQSSLPQEELKRRLIGNHVKIHNLDFEIMEREESLHIIPHAEQVDAIKTLPITSVEMQSSGGSTKVIITSRIRPLDLGGPQLIMILCALLLIVAGVLYYFKEQLISAIVFGVFVSIVTIFWIRMEMGYFDYVRKVRAYVKNLLA